MSKSAGGFWAKLQARSTIKVDPAFLTQSERDKRESKGRRKARTRKRREQARQQRLLRGNNRQPSKIEIEANDLSSFYLEVIAEPRPAVGSTNSSDAGKRSDEVFIYGLADPRDRVVRYVGKTHRPLLARLYEHEFKPSNQAVCEWLKTLRASCVKAEAVVLEVCHRCQWQSREIYWIAKLRKEHMLLNIAKGGKFYGPPKGKPAARATQAFHRKVIARSGPVKHLTREEIAAIYG